MSAFKILLAVIVLNPLVGQVQGFESDKMRNRNALIEQPTCPAITFEQLVREKIMSRDDETCRSVESVTEDHGSSNLLVSVPLETPRTFDGLNEAFDQFEFTIVDEGTLLESSDFGTRDRLHRTYYAAIISALMITLMMVRLVTTAVLMWGFATTSFFSSNDDVFEDEEVVAEQNDDELVTAGVDETDKDTEISENDTVGSSEHLLVLVNAMVDGSASEANEELVEENVAEGSSSVTSLGCELGESTTEEEVESLVSEVDDGLSNGDADTTATGGSISDASTYTAEEESENGLSPPSSI